MTDLFADKAHDYDARPVPQQISEGVFGALRQQVALDPSMTVLDFGAGTGLISTRLAPHVDRILAVDVSRAMLDRLASKPELQGKAEVICQDLMARPLDRQVDLVVSAMALHHVRDTPGLLATLFAHTAPGGTIALADLDAEDGTFHPPAIEGVFHQGFDRTELGALLVGAGFTAPRFVTAVDVTRDGRHYPVFLVVADKPAA